MTNITCVQSINLQISVKILAVNKVGTYPVIITKMLVSRARIDLKKTREYVLKNTDN